MSSAAASAGAHARLSRATKHAASPAYLRRDWVSGVWVGWAMGTMGRYCEHKDMMKRYGRRKRFIGQRFAELINSRKVKNKKNPPMWEQHVFCPKAAEAAIRRADWLRFVQRDPSAENQRATSSSFDTPIGTINGESRKVAKKKTCSCFRKNFCKRALENGFLYLTSVITTRILDFKQVFQFDSPQILQILKIFKEMPTRYKTLKKRLSHLLEHRSEAVHNSPAQRRQIFTFASCAAAARSRVRCCCRCSFSRTYSS